MQRLRTLCTQHTITSASYHMYLMYYAAVYVPQGLRMRSSRSGSVPAAVAA
jgi:hypothetical protein